MRTLAALGLLALVLAGCATSPPYGHFAASPVAVDQTIAADAVKQLTSLYPPAKTRLELQQPTPDAFGMALVEGLRERGYALLELDPKAAKAAAGAESGLALAYVLDEADGQRLYRLTLRVGRQSLSRAYRAASGTAVAAGAWARQE